MASNTLDILSPSKDKTCESYAVKLGEATRDTGMCVFLTDFGVPIVTHSYLWCLKGSDRTILVDTGFTARAPHLS